MTQECGCRAEQGANGWTEHYACPAHLPAKVAESRKLAMWTPTSTLSKAFALGRIASNIVWGTIIYEIARVIFG